MKSSTSAAGCLLLLSVLTSSLAFCGSTTLVIELVHADASLPGRPDQRAFSIEANGVRLNGDRALPIEFDVVQGDAERQIDLKVLDASDRLASIPLTVDVPALPHRPRVTIYVPVGPVPRLDDAAVHRITRDYDRGMPIELRVKQMAGLRPIVDVVVRDQESGLIPRNEVRATYSYLRIARDLAQTRGIRPDSLTLAAAEWLRSKIRTSKQTVDSSLQLGSSDAAELVQQTRGATATRYRRLYDAVKDPSATHDSRARCALYLGIQNRMEPLMAEMDEHLGFNDVLAAVSTASAECSRQAVMANAASPAAQEALARQIAVLERVEIRRVSAPMKDLVRGHRNALSRLRIP